MTRDILVTSALPYANGPLHLGHMLEHIQTDIWVRAQKLNGNNCTFICGSDAHGTPIMLKAEQLGITPEELVAKYHTEHNTDLKQFHVAMDNFHTTHSAENKALSQGIYQKLATNGYIAKRTISQAFDATKQMFLPDRYVTGTCPKCSAADQYGDSCEACGATYAPTELIDAKSVLSNTKPIAKDSEHLFFTLDKFQDFLKNWLEQAPLQMAVKHKLQEWFQDKLHQWDISRDAPYFGFEIPDNPGKYFYVWLDAPIGYLASLQNLCDKPDNNLDFDSFWNINSTAEIYHFIGKDIIYFHALFWPAILHGANYRTPTAVFAHGFLTINGTKMSKSRGTFITASSYLKHLDPECLRYYFAAKLNSNVQDLDLNLEDFVQRVNSDLVGKIVNIASRCAGFINKQFANTLANSCNELDLYNEFVAQKDTIMGLYEAREYSQAVRTIMALADKANQYIDSHKPWILIKDPDTKATAHQVCSTGLNLFRILVAYLQPITPVLTGKSEQFLNTKLANIHDINTPLTNHVINTFKPLMQRIELDKVNIMLEENKPQEAAKTTVTPAVTEPDYITIDDFVKVDLRIAKIVSAEDIPEADKLLKLTLDIGEDKPRQVFAGIKSAYSAAELTGKMTVMVANLKPRKMRFGVSEGMVLAAGPGGSDIWILEPHAGAQPGMRVK